MLSNIKHIGVVVVVVGTVYVGLAFEKKLEVCVSTKYVFLITERYDYVVQ